MEIKLNEMKFHSVFLTEFIYPNSCGVLTLKPFKGHEILVALRLYLAYLMKCKCSRY